MGVTANKGSGVALIWTYQLIYICEIALQNEFHLFQISKLRYVYITYIIQNPASKSCLNLNFKILTNPCAQSLNKSLALEPNVSSQICNKLLPTLSSASTSTTVTTSTSFEFPSSHTRVTSIKFTKRQSVSELVSE